MSGIESGVSMQPGMLMQGPPSRQTRSLPSVYGEEDRITVDGRWVAPDHAQKYDAQSQASESRGRERIRSADRIGSISIKNTFLCAEKDDLTHSSGRSSSAPPAMASTPHNRMLPDRDDVLSLRSDSTGRYTAWTMRPSPHEASLSPATAATISVLPVAVPPATVVETEPADQNIQNEDGITNGLSAEILAYGIPEPTVEKPLQVSFDLEQVTAISRRKDDAVTVSDEQTSQVSDSTFASSWSSSGDEADVVKLGFGTTNACLPLSEVMRLKSEKSASFGSLHGPHGRCVPCSFHFTHIHTPSRRPPCRASYLCEYCHDIEHCPKWRSKLRKCRPPPDVKRRQD